MVQNMFRTTRGPRSHRNRRAVWIGIVLSFLLPLTAAFLAAPARAVAKVTAVTVTVSVGWDGADCVDLIEPDALTSGRTTTATFTCEPGHGIAITYRALLGHWIGVDPVEEHGLAVACQLDVNGVTVMKNAGHSGVNCLGKAYAA